MSKNILGAVILLGGVALASPAAAQMPKAPPGPELLHAARAVGLSANQVTQIKKIALTSQREAVPIQGKLRLAQLDLQEVMEGDNPPAEKKVVGLIDRIGQLETQMKKNHILMMLRIRATMNKAQWDKLQKLHADREGRPPMPPGPPSPPSPPPPPHH
jgi:hypothetical protein